MFQLFVSQQTIKKIQRTTLGILLGLGGGFWLTPQAVTQQTMTSTTRRVDLSVSRQPGETYESLTQRAKLVALATTKELFSQAPDLANISIIVLGENQGVILPLLSLQLNRAQWQSQKQSCKHNEPPVNCLPTSLGWSNFTNARPLLGFDVATPNSAQPSVERRINMGDASKSEPPFDQLQEHHAQESEVVDSEALNDNTQDEEDNISGG